MNDIALPHVGAYVGRFAPSPTGPLHAGSAVAALGSWLDARAHGGRWLVRIEDVDTPRCVAGAADELLRQLAALGLIADAAPLWQSQRAAAYAAALARLDAAGLVYPCTCTRAQIAAAGTAGAADGRAYPGTCRPERGAPRRDGPAAWRLRIDDAARTAWHDRRLGAQGQQVGREIGDFILKRADGLWAYQLAVVVDDASQGVTDVVRGEDLADNTARQCRLQQALGLPRPRYLHLPLVRGADGAKLSKQHGAPPLSVGTPQQALGALRAAARALSLPDVDAATHVPDALALWVAAWRSAWVAPPSGGASTAAGL